MVMTDAGEDYFLGRDRPSLWEAERAEAEAWHHEMAEPPEEHDDGDDDVPPPDEPPAVYDALTDSAYAKVWGEALRWTVDQAEPPFTVRDVSLAYAEAWAEALRRIGWTVIPPDPNAGPLTSAAAPATSHEAARRAAITGGTVEAHILENCLAFGGWTTDEIEAASGRSHGSVSGAMNRLKRKGLVRETDETRPTRGGSPAFVYVLTDIAPEYR